MPRGLLMDVSDNVIVALSDVESGETVEFERGGERLSVDARDAVRFGHKIAVAAIPPGQSVTRYGQPIGVATAAIAPGQHVHTHNLKGTRGR